MHPVEAESSISQEFWRAVREKRFLLSCIVVGVAISLTATSFLFAPVFQAQEVLIPSNSAGGLGTLQGLGGLSGIASLAGIDIGANDKQTNESIAVLKSRQFTMAFIDDKNLMPLLFASKWDRRRHAWRVSGSKIPTENDAFRYFNNKIRFVSEDKITGLVTLTVDWRDRKLAAAWAAELVSRLNAQMRERTIAETNSSIALLKEQLAAANIVPLQQSLASLIEAQVKQRTFALVRPDFAFRVIDPPVIPDAKERIFPKRSLFFVLGLLAGTMAAALTAMTIALRRERVTE